MGRLTQLIDQTINRIYLIKSLQLARQRSVVKHCPFYPANSVIMKLVIIFLAVCILQIRETKRCYRKRMFGCVEIKTEGNDFDRKAKDKMSSKTNLNLIALKKMNKFFTLYLEQKILMKKIY